MATALCKHLHTNMGDEQAGRPCSVPHAKGILKGCGCYLSVTTLANTLSPWNKRLMGVRKNTFWHMVQGLVKLQSPSKSMGLFLLISREL